MSGGNKLSVFKKLNFYFERVTCMVCLVYFLSPLYTYAQDKLVDGTVKYTGVVSGSKNILLAGATVTVKGTGK
jgi:hypothetical protein